MSHLLREHAPITEGGWDLLDSEARERLAPALAARKLVDFAGPRGWQHSATNLGRVKEIADAPGKGVNGAQRRVLPLVELRAPFAIDRSELADADRGAEDADLEALDQAAHAIAVAENAAVFHGWKAAGITGILETSPHDAIELGEDCDKYPRHVAKAVDALLSAGVEGPYGLALGPEAHTRVLETSEHGGYPLLDHLRKIIGGPLVTSRAKPGQIVPVDSEHSTIAQCLRAGRESEVLRLVLTASGGPFRGWSRDKLEDVTPEQALAHPTWNMGPLVTINSATLVNKGLEVIEAHLLFGFGLDRIDVVVHPQSIVHSMVEFSDGATIIQASPPDMRLPISLGLAWPDRVPGAAPGLDWSTAASWTFEPLDDAAFPAVALARQAAAAGGTAPAVYNAANEACVADFQAGRIAFPRIVDTVAQIVSEHDAARTAVTTVADVLAVDEWARRRARELNA